MAAALVSISGLGLFIPGDRERKMILRDLDWELQQGSHCAVLGPNGSGKSTLLRLLSGRLWPASGKIRWLGAEGPDPSPITGQAISSLVSPAMQEEFQRMAWQCSGRGFMERVYFNGSRETADLEKLAGRLECDLLLPMPVKSLSQGQLRMLMLAGALLRKPRLLLLDECLDGLDTRHRKLFLGVLDDYAGTGTVVMATHRAEDLPKWIKNFYRLDSGKLEKLNGPPRLPGAAGRARPAPRAATAECVLELCNASVYIDRQKILKNIDWKMRAGEHWLISGANGSGKSTFLRLLAGLELTAAGGSVSYNLGVTPGTSLDQLRRRIFLVSGLGQALYGYDLSVLDLLCSGFDNSIGIYRSFSGQEITRARDLLQKFFPAEFCEEFVRRPMRSLSTGQLRRLFLARAAIVAPRLLLLDEPLSGLDGKSRRDYGEMLEKMLCPDESGAPATQVVFVSHNPQDAPAFINRWAHMENGRMVIAPAHCARDATSASFLQEPAARKQGL